MSDLRQHGIRITGGSGSVSGGAPAAHATTHQPGGTDAMAVDAIAGTGSLRTLGTASTAAAAGDHAHALTALTNIDQSAQVLKAPVRVASTANGTLATAFENGD